MIYIIQNVKRRTRGHIGNRDMGHSQAEKAQSRERILKEAAAQIREAGLESVSVGKLMKKANLTHGGFYGHFDSRSDLLAAALERALAEGAKTARAGADAARPRTFAAMARSYLSRAHRDARGSGCAIAALVSDVGRADEAPRAAMANSIERYIEAVARALGTEDEGEAMFAVSAMVGALALSRVMTDPARSDALLRATRDRLTALLGDDAG